MSQATDVSAAIVSGEERRAHKERCMQELMWETFSARFNHATQADIEASPELKKDWETWNAAWNAGSIAQIEWTLNSLLQEKAGTL